MAKLQLLRNQAPLTGGKSAAITSLNNYVSKADSTASDGELVLARYYVNGSNADGGIKTLVGVCSIIGTTKTIDIFEDLTDEELAEKYLTKDDASSTYITKTNASSTYLTKTDASSTYLKKTDASNTYSTIANAVNKVTTAANGAYNLQNENSTTLDTLSYSIQNVTTGLGTNVRTAYQLVDKDNHKAGVQIEIPKDRALLGVALTQGAADNLPTFNENTKKFTAPATGTKHDVLAFAYSLENGTTQVVVIDVADFLRESEFNRNDFAVTNGEVSLKEDRIKAIIGNAGPFGGTGKIITTVQQTNGKITATAIDNTAASIPVADADSVFTGTNVEAVLKELDEKINNVSTQALGVAAGKGIEISGTGTVKTIAVKKDTASEKYLDVTTNGVKVSGIDNAISTAINGLGSPKYDSNKYVQSVFVQNGMLGLTTGQVEARQVKFANANGTFTDSELVEQNVETVITLLGEKIKGMAKKTNPTKSGFVEVLGTETSKGYISNIEYNETTGNILVTRVKPYASSDDPDLQGTTMGSSNIYIDNVIEDGADGFIQDMSCNLNTALSKIYAETQNIDCGYVAL